MLQFFFSFFFFGVTTYQSTKNDLTSILETKYKFLELCSIFTSQQILASTYKIKMDYLLQYSLIKLFSKVTMCAYDISLRDMIL